MLLFYSSHLLLIYNFFFVQRTSAHQIADTTLPRSDPNLSAPDKGKYDLVYSICLQLVCTVMQGTAAIDSLGFRQTFLSSTVAFIRLDVLCAEPNVDWKHTISTLRGMQT